MLLITDIAKATYDPNNLENLILSCNNGKNNDFDICWFTRKSRITRLTYI